MNVIILLPARYRPLVLPLISLSLVVLLTLTLGRFIFDGVVKVRKDIEELGSKNKTLESKLTVLQSLQKDELEGQVKTALLAVPSENPILFALSTVRNLAQESAISMSNFRIGEKQEQQGGSERDIEMSFSLSGIAPSVFSFIKTIQNAAPLMRITGFSASSVPGGFSANISVSSSWQSLPAELGKTESPIEGINSAEAQLLQKLAKLRKPPIGEISVSSPVGKENPFAF